MLMIVFIILIFWLGISFGYLWGLKEADKSNDEWCLLATKINDDWAKYCETLIEKIKTLESGDTE